MSLEVVVGDKREGVNMSSEEEKFGYYNSPSLNFEYRIQDGVNLEIRVDENGLDNPYTMAEALSSVMYKEFSQRGGYADVLIFKEGMGKILKSKAPGIPFFGLMSKRGYELDSFSEKGENQLVLVHHNLL